MTIQDYLNLFGTIGLITTGSLVGSLLTILIQHFLDKGKLKTERQSNLQKEIYFNLQKHAEKFIFQIDLMGIQSEEIGFWLKKQFFTEKLPNIEKIEKLRDMSVIQIYFSYAIGKKYDEVVKIFRDILDIYFTVGKTNQITKEQGEQLKVLYPKFNDASNNLKSLILKELSDQKEQIIK